MPSLGNRPTPGGARPPSEAAGSSSLPPPQLPELSPALVGASRKVVAVLRHSPKAPADLGMDTQGFVPLDKLAAYVGESVATIRATFENQHRVEYMHISGEEHIRATFKASLDRVDTAADQVQAVVCQAAQQVDDQEMRRRKRERESAQ